MFSRDTQSGAKTMEKSNGGVTHETGGLGMLSGSTCRGLSKAVFPNLFQVRAHVENGMIWSARQVARRLPSQKRPVQRLSAAPAPHSHLSAGGGR